MYVEPQIRWDLIPEKLGASMDECQRDESNIIQWDMFSTWIHDQVNEREW